jgi:membrane protein required for colicin V production
MNWIDITILLIISFSIFWGVRKGFFNTFFSFFYIIVSFYLSGYLCHIAAPTIGQNHIVQWAVFTFIFIVIFLILSLIGRFLRFVGNIVISGVADVVGGLVLGFFRGFIVCIFILFCVVLLKFDKAEILEKSLIAPRLIRPVKTLLATPPDRLKDALEKQVKDLKGKSPAGH